MPNLTEILLAEIDKDEADAEHDRRIIMLGLARAWDEGRRAALNEQNPYADV